MPYAVPGCAVMRIKITIKTGAKAYAASASSYKFQNTLVCCLYLRAADCAIRPIHGGLAPPKRLKVLAYTRFRTGRLFIFWF